MLKVFALWSVDFFKNQLFQKIFQESEDLDQDKDRRYVCPHLGPNRLQRFTIISRQISCC